MKRISLFILVLVTLGFIYSCSKEETEVTVNQFAMCDIPPASEKMQVATMNVEFFPKDGKKTMRSLASLILKMDVDVIALQEVRNKSAIDELVKELPGWSGVFTTSPSQQQSLAYVYKKSEIDLISNKALFTTDSYAFPRPPFVVEVRHKPSKKKYHLINVHLKAMGDAESQARRKDAAQKLKTYVDTYLATVPVMVLGDFNDQIKPTGAQTFSVLINDKNNYRFADMSIATGSSAFFSYPSWPSHIDHILITNELFNLVDTVMVYRPEICVPSYRDVVTDHRPVVMFLR